jgi:hypothetical protein
MVRGPVVVADRTVLSNAGAERLTGTPAPQPAMPPLPFGTRAAPTRGMRAARRGAALVRMLFLVGFTGFLVAVVVATMFASVVIVINGRLP